MANDGDTFPPIAIDNDRMALVAQGGTTDELPTALELELVGQLRARFSEPLAKRDAEGLTWPCFFGDMALTRVVRGNEGSLEAAATWFERFLAKFQEYQVDDLVVEMTKRLNESGGRGANALLSGREEVEKHFGMIYAAPKLSSKGDIVTYVPMVDINKPAIIENISWDCFVQYMRSATILHVLDCDRLSEAQGRVVKVVMVVDLAGVSMTSLSNSKFDEVYDRDIARFQEELCAENMGNIYIVNAPWWVVKLFNLFSRFIPEKLTRKFYFVDGDGTADEDFLELIGGIACLQQMFSTRVGSSTDPNDVEGEHDISAGRVYERIIDAKPGQKN